MGMLLRDAAPFSTTQYQTLFEVSEAIANDTLYIRTEKHLYAFAEKK